MRGGLAWQQSIMNTRTILLCFHALGRLVFICNVDHICYFIGGIDFMWTSKFYMPQLCAVLYGDN